MARKRAENRERSVGYPRFVKPVLDSKPCGEKEKITRVPRDCVTRTHLKKIPYISVWQTSTQWRNGKHLPPLPSRILGLQVGINKEDTSKPSENSGAVDVTSCIYDVVPDVQTFLCAVLIQVSLSKHLGINLEINWGTHITETSEKGLKRLNLLKRLTATKWGATQEVLTTVYKTYVRPVLDYGCGVVPLSNKPTLEIATALPSKRLNLSNMSSNKADAIPEELKSCALETIEKRHPANEWLHIYTDGSYLP
ncbi:hypothetical protein TNCV_4588261 [Trichonephila clavipes]|nr:hypothetical protein TNCV_4588261 [Trichonephila clavipes]